MKRSEAIKELDFFLDEKPRSTEEIFSFIEKVLKLQPPSHYTYDFGLVDEWEKEEEI